MKFLVLALTAFCYVWSLALVVWAVLMYAFNQPCTFRELHWFAAFAAIGFLIFGAVFFFARDSRRFREKTERERSAGNADGGAGSGSGRRTGE